MKPLRCAVYTRKSTEDGLEQEFNSLDAQREACEAYILSQRHEGWSLVPGRYDDGGYSGGNMERPGLKALMAEIDAGQIDVIVVYKVDRLTRSLADFAKIVERLDARQASFVSVTQAFNTTTSMGRLTLNVLLSFAQFEREVTGERIRDKIAASKKKGIWMGGPVPLGYQVIDRKLIPVPEEAERVRIIMRRYLEVRNVPRLIEILRAEGVVTKVQQRVSGPHRGGIPFARGSLFHLLKNPVYRGKIVHKGKVYDGEHEAIVDEVLWNQVQSHLAAKAPPRKRSTNEPQQAMLRGLITDPHGRPMVPTYGSSKVKRYAYYETRKDLARPGDPPGIRFQRGQLEQHLIGHLEELLGDEHALRRLSGIEEAGTLRTMFATAHLLAVDLREIGKVETALRSLVAAISIQADCMEITLKPGALSVEADAKWTWTLPLPTRRPFREARLRIDASGNTTSTSSDLLALMADAMAAQRLVLASPELSPAQLAKREGRCRTQLTRLLRLSWMSPRIVDAIADGTQPKGLTRRALLICDMPIDWAEQERQFGFAA
ncbi:recombinase family protein [Novosphingobium sp.]|uniref:recombinase family protein n=1 Tax=Novosphingobium sp. TaxID=1874826 RepID=UPI0022C8428D|nr:recombinase family protein [Novosphingobium sp.]MCZ8020016.1 recombinase family protein [Novosphingobium sp.]MCZ8035661.1 recombinase family protein [Novosphingobium sp.]MCZ8053059.1 recombinase family protein [Novosphingobium sp.]MCZ8061056.1 recombinase family protein [Novosphingobium sp.]MCZ8230785.1 recombinase family protein [Novosphingobium sp.]